MQQAMTQQVQPVAPHQNWGRIDPACVSSTRYLQTAEQARVHTRLRTPLPSCVYVSPSRSLVVIHHGEERDAAYDTDGGLCFHAAGRMLFWVGAGAMACCTHC